jgi:hypothetical protein
MAKMTVPLFTTYGGGEFDETATVKCHGCGARESMNTEYVESWKRAHARCWDD